MCRQVDKLKIFIILSVLLSSVAAVRPDNGRSPAQYVTDRWSVQDGLPSGRINSIVQTPDGYLWLASAAGLVRFDGIRFSASSELQDALGKEIVVAGALLVGRDGSLWVGGDGFLCSLKNGKASVFRAEIDVSCMAESADGSIWIGLSWAGLIRFRDGRFINYPVVTGLVRAVCEDRAGKVWLGGLWNGLYCLKGDRLLAYVIQDGPSDSHIRAIREDRAGNLWVATRRGLEQFRNGKLLSLPGSEQGVTSLLVDRAGRLWTGGSDGSISRGDRLDTGIQPVDRPEKDVLCLFQDREGSVWAGTDDGLTRIRETKFGVYTTAEGLIQNKAAGVIAGRDGTIWLFSDGGGISAIKDGVVKTFTAKNGLGSNFGGSLFESRDGSIWAGTANGLSRIRDGRVTSFSSGQLARHYVSAIFEDRNGMVIAIPLLGMFRFDNGTLTPYPEGQALRESYVYQGLQARDGTVWIASGDGLARVRGKGSRIFKIADGLPINNVTSIFEDREGTLWLATGKAGVIRFKHGRFVALSMKDGLFDDRVTRALADDAGNLWMGCPRGVFRVPIEQVDSWAQGKIKRVECVAYGVSDGMKSSECSHGAQTPGCRTKDGVLWFPTSNGVVWIDPRVSKMNRLPPPVSIEQIVADDEAFRPIDRLELSPGRQRIEFDFTALSLVVPQKVQFRYKLEGFDKDWVEAGSRRAAYYTNVSPGWYRFRVIACNDDGLWNETGASLSLHLQPYFYQTPYFVALVLLILAAASVGVYRLRMFEIRKRYLAVLDERNRIARDMHDTFAQNLGGVALQLDSIKMQFRNSPPELRQKLDQTSRMIRYSLAEAYRAVRDLRSLALETRELAEALPEVARLTTAGTDITLDIKVVGTARKLSAVAEDNLLRIFQETIANAVKHGKAGKIEAELRYDSNCLSLRVVDDGCGFDTEKAFFLGEGHYGLLGMRERVDRIGGEMALNSKPGQGTEVLVRVPVPS